ncbi:SCAN domain-containing protein 3-like [Palaemon carinicauda]|uniref:SCAN domain-containing protein 3-like n=1 Tax=Palaemon carinicauda TaxID=392227 RepID=UPI0035B60495
MKDLWLHLVHGKPLERHRVKVQLNRPTQNIKGKLTAWLSDNNTRDWYLDFRFVQSQKNSSCHSGIKSTPYSNLLRENPKDGLSSSSLLQEVIDRLEKEDDLAALGAQPPTDPTDKPLEASEPVIIPTQPS